MSTPLTIEVNLSPELLPPEQLRLFPRLDWDHEKEIAKKSIVLAKEILEKKESTYSAIDRILEDPNLFCVTITCSQCGDTSLIGQYETNCPQCGATEKNWKLYY